MENSQDEQYDRDRQRDQDLVEGHTEETDREFLDCITEISDRYERLLRSGETKRGLREAARQGHFVSARAPYGYQKVAVTTDGRRHWTLELDPEEAAVIKEIYDGGLSHLTDRHISRKLHERGIPSPTGGPWTPEMVRRIQNNEVCCGTLVHGAKGNDPVRVLNAFPGVVSQGEYDRVQEITRNRRAQGHKPG